MTPRDMLEVLRAAGWRHTLADVIGLIAMVVSLYAITLVADAMVRR